MSREESLKEIELTVRTGYVNWQDYLKYIQQPQWLQGHFETREETDRRLEWMGRMQKEWRSGTRLPARL